MKANPPSTFEISSSDYHSSAKLNSDPSNPSLGSRPYNVFYIIQMALIIAMGGFLFGYDTGIIGGAALYFTDDFPDITSGQKEMIVSLAVIGAGVGAVIMGPVSDNFGRKISMMIGDWLFGFGALLVFVFFMILYEKKEIFSINIF